MKKLLLLTTVGLLSYASANATTHIRLSANPTFATTLESGKKYLIYDATKIKANSDQDRTAFRYVNTTTNAILGDHSVTPAAGGDLLQAERDAYLWSVTGDESNGWTFQNVATSKYIPTTTDGNNMSCVDAIPEFTHKFVETYNTTYFLVQHTGTGQNVWDGRPSGGNYAMCKWAKQDDTNNNHFYQFIEYTDEMAANEFDSYDVTLNLPFGEQTLTVTVSNVLPETTVSEIIPAYLGFECTQGGDSKVTAEATTFTLQGNWKYLDKVGRINNRLGESPRNFWSYDADANKVKTQKSEYANAPTTDRLFKLNGKIENNKLYVNIQNVAAGEGKYLNVENTNNNNASFTENEQWFEVRQSAYSNQGFMLGVSGNTCVQDYYGNPTLGAYTGDCTNDPSAVICFFEVTEESATSAFESAINYNFGTTVGTYHATETGKEAIKEFLTAVETNPLGVTLDTYTTAYTTVNNNVELNMPLAGRFYRIIGSNGQYLAATATDAAGRANQKNDDGTDNNGAETVFYYDGSHLISMRNGLVLGSFTDGHQKFEHVSANTSSIVFKGGQVVGQYLLQTATNIGGKDYFIYGATNNTVNRGSLQSGLVPSSTTPNTENNYAGYFWTIEELAEGSGSRWLPLYVGAAAKHVTVYSPVTLTNAYGRLEEVHTLYVNPVAANELVKTPIDDKVIPANTPCYVVLADGAVDANGSVYLPFNYSDAVVGQDNQPNALTGSFTATQKSSDKSYFTVKVDTDSKVRFMAHDAAQTYIPGFTAHYAVAENPAEKYEVFNEDEKSTSGISEIVAGGENGAKVIYDLQGRRVNRASKGIFIVNGVKTLVK